MRKLLIVGAIAMLAACSSEKEERGLTLMPDMYNTPAYESQDAGTMEVEARDAQGQPIRRVVHYPAMLSPPEGTAPRGFRPYPLAATDFAGARLNRNPLPLSTQVLKQGQRDYLSFCAPCHGRDGNAANGHIAASFSGIPSLNGLSVLQLSEGELFHITTMGKGRMSNLRAQLPPESRWAVVRFVRVQALANLAAEDVGKLIPYIDNEIAKNPDDTALQARRSDLIRLAEEAKAALAALGSAGDGHEFLPSPPPMPEYVEPSWPMPEVVK